MSVNIHLNRHPIGFQYLKRKVESQVIQNRNERLPYLDPAYTPLYDCLIRVFQMGILSYMA
jgi:hypothetical protein